MSKIFTESFHEEVATQKQEFISCLCQANRADELSTFEELAIARAELHKAKGMHQVLDGLGLLSLSEKGQAVEELERLTEKLVYARKEKQRKSGMLWKKH